MVRLSILFFGFVCKPLSSRGSKSHGMSPSRSEFLHSLSTSLMTRQSSSPLPSATTTLQKFLNWSVLLFLFLLSLPSSLVLQLRSAYFGIAMMAVMHGYFKFTQPLFVQALMGLKGLFDAKPVAIHILNKPATGDLKRPFTTPSLMGRTFSSIVAHHSFTVFLLQLHRVHHPILLPLPRLKSVLEQKRRTDSSVR